MKKNIALIAALVAGTVSASAQELGVSTTFAWESKYVFRGVQLADETFMPSVDFSYGGGYLGIWAAMPVDNVASNAAEYDAGMWTNEVDIYAGYGFALGEVLSADVGATYYTYPSIQDELFDDGTNSLELYAGISAEVMLSPAVYVYYDLDLEAFTIEGSIGHSIPLGETVSLDLGAYLGHVSPDEDDSWTYYGASADVAFAINENASISVGARWAGNSEDQFADYEDNHARMVGTTLVPADFDDNAVWFGFSISAGF